jgi:outer membrane protein TolC
MRASLFRFGADVAQEDSAEFGILKQEAKLKSLQLKAEADAAASLIAAVAATMDLAIIRKLHATSEELLRVAKKQYQKGSLASQDVLKIEVDLGSSQTRLLEAQATVEKTEGMIAPYLGGDSVEKQWPLRDLVLSGASPLVRPQDLNSLEVPSEQSSPAIKAAALEVKEQEALVVAARARQRPSVDLTAGISSQLSNSSLSPPQAQAGISLSVPIFDRFEGASSTQAAIHLKQAAAANLEAQSRENVRAFNAARIALKAALLTIQTHERLLVAASSLYRDNLARFERGLVSVNELTLDQNRLLSAELAVSQSWRAVHEHLFDLCHAMGKGIKACLNKGAG